MKTLRFGLLLFLTLNAGLARAAGSLQQLWEDYRSSVQEADPLERMACLAALEDHVMSLNNRDEYMAALTYLDTFSASEPEAVYDLARNLQISWQRLYGHAFLKEQKGREKNYSRIGAVVGITAALASSFYRPAALPRAFAYIALSFPLIGAAGGDATAALVNRIEILRLAYPPAPAQLMHLGYDLQDPMQEAPEESQVYREALALTAGAAVFAGGVQVARALSAIRWLNLASTPAKFNPLVLAGTIAGSWLLEEGISYAAYKYDESQVRARFTAAQNTYLEAERSGDARASLHSAEELAKAAGAAADFYVAPAMKLVETNLADFENSAGRAAKTFGTESWVFQNELNKLTAGLERTNARTIGALFSPAHRKEVARLENLEKNSESANLHARLKTLAAGLRSAGDVPRNGAELLLKSSALLRSAVDRNVNRFGDRLWIKLQSLRARASL